MQSATLIILMLLLTGAAEAQVRDQPGDVELEVSDAQLARLDLGTLRLEATQSSATIDAVARVMDVGPLAQLDSEIEGATAAADASAREAERLGLLAADDQGASLQALQAAQAQSAADSARSRLARQRVALEWSSGLAQMGLSRRRQLVEQIAAGQAALLRVDPLQMQRIVDGDVRLQLDENSPPLVTESLGPATLAEPRMQTMGLFAVVRGDGAAPLRAGRLLHASIETGQPVSGVLLPRSAIVRTDGAAWAYLVRDANRFVRREVRDPRQQDAGWFVLAGFGPGDVVVARGAGTLLAVESAVDADE